MSAATKVLSDKALRRTANMIWNSNRVKMGFVPDWSTSKHMSTLLKRGLAEPRNTGGYYLTDAGKKLLELPPQWEKWGDVTVPDGKRGPWTIDTIVLTASDVLVENLRAARDGNGFMMCREGTYKRLSHAQRGVVMSNTPMECRTAYSAFSQAVGHVLVNGLGLGMVVEGLLHKPGVKSIRVIEIDKDVISLVSPHLDDHRLRIINADAYEYKPDKGEKFDYVWHDIWDTLDIENLPLMAKLNRKYGRIAKAQGTWSRDEIRRDARRWS